MPDQRDHDLGPDVDALLLQGDGGFEDRPHLHLDDLREEQAEPDAAQAEHGVLLAHALDGAQQALLLLQLGLRGSLHLQDRHLDQLVVVAGQELVERRVDQPDDDREPVHLLEDAGEVGALEGQQFGQPPLAFLAVLGQDHLLHEGQALLLHEHVLGAAEPDALGAEAARHLGVARIVGIGPDAQAPLAVGPGEELVQVLVDGRLDHRDRAQDDLAGRAVDGDQVALSHGLAVDREQAPGQVDFDHLRPRHTGLAHPAGYHGRVAGLAAARGQHAPGHDQAVDVVGVGLDPDQDDGLALFTQRLGAVGVEDRLAAGRAGGGVEPFRDHVDLGLGIDAPVQQLVDVPGLDSLQRLLLCDQPFPHHVDRDLHRGLGGALARAGLQHPELALLDRELEVLDVAVMTFQLGGGALELVVDLGQLPLQG